MVLVTCTSCKADEPYIVKDYLNYLSNRSGINNSKNIEDNIDSLLKWGIITTSDNVSFNDELDYAFMAKTICKLIEVNGNPLDVLKNKGWIKNDRKEINKVSKQTAEEIVDKAVNIINNKEYDKTFEYDYKTEIKDLSDDLKVNDIIYDQTDNSYKKVKEVNEDNYTFEDAEFEDVFSSFDIADSYEIDFSNAEVIPLHEEEKSSYVNNIYNLLASKNHVFSTDGFRVSYTLSSSGIDVHVSKKIDRINVYFDSSINSVKPTFKWTYKADDLKNCYFNLKMNTTTSLGASFGKYGDYYIKLKDLDSNSFMSKIKSMIVPKNDEVEAMIPICQIKTPIPDVPFVYLNMTVGIKLYVSGKVELVLYNSDNIGFEIKNGNPRFIFEHNDDVDNIARASAKAALALNIGLDATKYRLCDVEFDGGIKSEVKTTVHLYDSDFNETSVNSDIDYSTLEELSKDNPYVKVCGDASLYWMLDLICNTSKSMLYKWGFTKTYNISNENNQVFGNLHHIEDGQFVKKCTRKTKPAISNSTFTVNTSNKIVLNSYAEVILVGNKFNIEILALPEGYTSDDIRYSSSDTSVASVSGSVINALKPGNTKINVHTSDNKYNSYINVLVSTG